MNLSDMSHVLNNIPRAAFSGNKASTTVKGHQVYNIPTILYSLYHYCNTVSVYRIMFWKLKRI